MEKEKIVFQTDDPEILAFIYSLGRSRSKVINQLLRDCLEDGGGYVSPRIMAETGFSYKNKKPIDKAIYISPSKKPKPKSVQYAKAKPMSRSTTTTAQKVVSEPDEPEVLEEIATENPEQEIDYNSTVPKITNPRLAMAGLSAFGGM